MFAIKSIHMKNFKCYSDTKIIFSGKNNSHKSLIITYGANGSGKTTLLESVAFFESTTNTLLQQKQLQDQIQGNGQSFTELPFKAEFILKALEQSVQESSLKSLIKNVYSADTHDNIELVYEFFVDSYVATYSLTLSEDGAIEESLDYPLNKNKTCCYRIKNNERYINDNLFGSDEYKKHIETQLDMYYGNHTLLSIINYDYQNNNDEYTKKMVNENLVLFLRNINNITISLHGSRIINPYNSTLTNRLYDSLEMGYISNDERDLLCEVEKTIPTILSSLFKDITNAWYEITDDSEKKRIKYELYVNRRMNGKNYVLPFDKESSGTKKILGFIPYIISAMSGNIVIIDEYGEDMHEKLARDLLVSLVPNITGQLIISTHMTGLLTKEKSKQLLSEEFFYFIKNDPESIKIISCLTDIEHRLHKNYNYQDRYFMHPLFEQYLPDTENDFSVKLKTLLRI